MKVGCRNLWEICIFTALLSAVVGTAGAARPNILLILADDLGWNDLGGYGHPWHETPHLDALARDGMRFTFGYAAAPICSASRASILTGKSPARLGFEFVTKDKAGGQQIKPPQKLQAPPFTLNLPLDERTIPEVLREAGYTTAFFGKWHLNAHHGGYLGWSPTHGPKAQGFEVAEEDFGSHPYSYRKRGTPKVAKEGAIPADSMTQRAIRFLERDHDRPFFLMVSHFFVHTPVTSPCEWLREKYEKKIPREAANREKRVTYAAFVETLDHHVGQLLAAMETTGHREDTVVVFTSDNGGHPEFAGHHPLRGSKWNLYEGGVRVPFVVRWPGTVIPGSASDCPVIGYDLLPTFAEISGGKTGGKKLDGRSLVKVFREPGVILDRTLCWHFPYYHPERGFAEARPEIGVNDFAVSQTRPVSALLHGDHKVLYFHEDDRIEYYHLGIDPGESGDAAASLAAEAERYGDLLMERLEDAGARMPTKVQGRRKPPNTRKE